MKKLFLVTVIILTCPAVLVASTFERPVTVKETKGPGQGIERSYYQGGNLILQQWVGISPGSFGQLIYYKGTVIVKDEGGTKPIPMSSRSVDFNNFKVIVQSIAADKISPERVRIVDSTNQEIISEFFVDKSGLMRPVTKAESDADIALRRQQLTAK